MEAIRYSVLLFLLSCFVPLTAQQENLVRAGLISGRLTISPSYMFAAKQPYYYLHGAAEGYVTNTISLSGEGYYSAGSTASNALFKYNHSGFFGASRHFIFNNNDLFIGLQPGLSYTKLNFDHTFTSVNRSGLNPLMSVVAGYNVYFHRFFHFFIQSRLVVGEHHYYLHKNITEIRLSAGLGFHVNAVKK